MDGKDVRMLAMRIAAGLPGAEHGFPFGPEYDVFKVGGKVFLLTGDVRGDWQITLKCEPESGLALQEEFASIIPGHHMNKKHWITVGAGGDIDEDLIDELVRTSYTLVVGMLPRDRRPLLSARAVKGIEAP